MRQSNWNLKDEEEKKQIIESRKEGMLVRYGVENASLVEEFQVKRKETFDKLYGGNPMFSKEVKEKHEHSVLDKYGVTNVSFLPEIREKIAEKNRKPFPEVIEDLKKFNIAPLFEAKDYKGKRDHSYRGKCLVCDNEFDFHFIANTRPNQCPVCKKNKKSLEKYDFVVKRLLRFNMTPLFSEKEYMGRYTKDYKKIKCNICQTEMDYVISVSNDFVCPTCNPFSPVSKPELQIQELLKSKGIEIQVSNRRIIPPYELDIYVPSKNIAIEFNGLYWHSEKGAGKKKEYHLEKHNKCLEKGIRLIQIFEDEWKSKRSICEGIILSALGKEKKKVNGRSTKIINLDSSQERSFLETYHLQGYASSSNCYGLEYEGQLISMMSFVKSRFDKEYNYELLRYAVDPEFAVVGGFSKLLHAFSENNKGSIISYCDKRLFSGEVYKNNGFTFSHSSPPNYYYTIDNYHTKVNRQNFMKHKLQEKLAKYDASLTEWENMQLNGYDRIWDCGTDVWIKKIT